MSMLLQWVMSTTKVEGFIMDHLPTGPYPYTLPLADGLATVESKDSVAKYHTKFGCFDSETDRDWEKIERFLEEIEWMNLLDGKGAWEGLVTRIELFRGYDSTTQIENRRGLVAFDDGCCALFHAVHALLGYEGSGSILSRKILTAVGVPLKMFEEANRAVVPGSYTVIFSRENTEMLEGVLVSKFAGCKDEWEYWIAPR